MHVFRNVKCVAGSSEGWRLEATSIKGIFDSSVDRAVGGGGGAQVTVARTAPCSDTHNGQADNKRDRGVGRGERGQK